MDFGKFMAALNTKSLPHVFLLSGEEDYFIRRAKAKLLTLLKKNAALQEFSDRLDSDDLIAAASEIPFFSENNILLVKNFPLLTGNKGKEKPEGKAVENKQKRFAAFVADIPEESYIIFEIYGKIDKRRRAAKVIEEYGLMLDAQRVRPWNINEFLQSKLQRMNRELAPDARSYFLEAVSLMQPISLSFLDMEFDKLALYTENRVITRQELTESFSGVPEVSNFVLADAITARDIKTALKILERRERDGEFMPLLLAVIANRVRQLLQMSLQKQRGMTSAAIAKECGLPPNIVERQLRANISQETLTKAMVLLADADYRLKTGRGDAALLTNILIELCGK